MSVVAVLPAGRRKAVWPARLWNNALVKTALPFAVVVAAWWLVAALQIFPAAFFIGPDVMLAEARELVRKGILTDYLAESCMRLLVGATTGLLVGIPAGYLIGLNRYVRRAAWPLLLFFQAIADIAWLPLLIVWFGFSLTSVNFVIVYAVFFPLVLSIVAGIDGVPEDLTRAARSLGANRRQILFEVVIPGSLAAATTGIRTGLGYGWRALVAAEIIVGTSGIGFMMFDARRAGQIAAVFLGMIILGILWYAVDALILARLERETVERWGIVKRVGN